MAARLPAPLRTALFHALRTAFRLTPMPVATRDRLRQRFLDRHADLVPDGPRGQIADSRLPRRAYVRADERAIGYVPYRKESLPDPLPARLVAFYLPQFHSIPENDAWWGKGFTEWRNVTRALPQFEGHVQPKLPGELGYYDLRHPEVMHAQAQLAREYGIAAFCFYFYWFGGKTLLEAPLRNWLADASIDLQFCLCWANEKWSRTWDGRGDEILIDQQHSAEDDLAFIAHVAEYLRDQRYLRVDGKPMLLVYRPGLFPDLRATAQRWRAWCREHGVGEIHLAYVQGFDQVDPADIGFDAAVEFPPNLSNAPAITARQTLINPDYSGHVLDWRAMAHHFRQRPVPDYLLHRGVNCGWDNEARRSGRGRSFIHASPRGYRDWLCDAVQATRQQRARDGLVFINAWNEWAEGAMLEPDARHGHAWLQASRDALAMAVEAPVQTHQVPVRPVAVIHAYYPDLLREILALLAQSETSWRIIVTTVQEQQAQVAQIARDSGLACEIQVHANRGRDILPFLHVADRLLDEGVEVVLKLHTKRSPHRDDGAQIRGDLLQSLAAPENVMQILQGFADPSLGMVACQRHYQPVSAFVGANGPGMDYLRARFALTGPAGGFAAGSMFWVRLRGIRSILDAGLGPEEFEAEAGQIDGTLAHAVERCLGDAVEASGLRVELR